MCTCQRNSHAAVGPSQYCILPSFCTEQATCDRDHTHLIEFVHGCGYYLRAATISFIEFQVWLLFKASCYLGCGFCSNKYSMHTINGNAVQGCLSENYIANMNIYHTKYLGQEMFVIYGTMYWGTVHVCVHACWQKSHYRIFPLLSACAYISTGRKPALNSKVRLIARCA